jgi:hypothetical protein|tara:strand:- start:907 stop:1026 length:120 start_codon:yes stop_codon:yes gene_type:complete
MQNKNQIIKQDSQVVSDPQKQQMNSIVNRIVELIREKHL